jgi:hypothetical protein
VELARRLLKGLLALGAASVFFTAGSLAGFTAQTSNPGNTISTGTLVLSNTKQGGTACLSTAGGSTNTNVNDACSVLFNLAAQKPGDSSSVNLTLKNDGSLAASAFTVYALGGCADSDAPGETYHGSGSLCNALRLYIQRYSDAGFSTPSACLYGGAAGASCNFSDTSKTLGAFASSYPSASGGLAISGGLAAGASAYLKVAVQLPSTAGNSIQGRRAATTLSWHLAQ